MKKKIEYYLNLIDENRGKEVSSYIEKRITSILKANSDIKSCNYIIMYDRIALYDINHNDEFTLNLSGYFDGQDEQTQSAFVILNLKEQNVKIMTIKVSRIKPIIAYFQKMGLEIKGSYERR